MCIYVFQFACTRVFFDSYFSSLCFQGQLQHTPSCYILYLLLLCCSPSCFYTFFSIHPPLQGWPLPSLMSSWLKDASGIKFYITTQIAVNSVHIKMLFYCFFVFACLLTFKEKSWALLFRNLKSKPKRRVVEVGLGYDFLGKTIMAICHSRAASYTHNSSKSLQIVCACERLYIRCKHPLRGCLLESQGCHGRHARLSWLIYCDSEMLEH